MGREARMPYREGRSFRRAARLYRRHDKGQSRAYPALMAVLAMVVAAGLVLVLMPQARTLLSSSNDPADPCAGPTAAASARARQAADPTPAPTASATAPAGPSPSASSSASPDPSPSASPSASATASATPCPSPSPSASAPAPPPAVNANCDIIVPAKPLTARGLSTPWQLTGPDGQSPEA